MDLTPRQWGLLITFSYLLFIISANYSVPAPVYPKVAEGKGASATEYTIVFGISDVTSLISSLALPYSIPQIGTKWLLYGGIIVQGVAVCAFGTLNWIQGLTNFLTLSSLIRIIQGVGFSAYFIGTYMTSSSEFAENFPIVIGIYEMCAGIGIAAGAAIGGFMFQFTGFLICFVSFGVLILLPVPILATLGVQSSEKNVSEEKINLLSLFRHYVIVINLFILILAYVFIKFLNPILEPFLRHTFHLDSHICGYIIASNGISFAIASPFWGYVITKYKTLKLCTLSVGMILVLIGSAVIGPMLSLQPSIIFAIIGLVLIGIGNSVIGLSVYFILLDETAYAGFGDGGSAVGCMAGCIVAADAIAGIIGPPVAGILFDNFGFLNATLYIFFSTCGMVLLTLSYKIVLVRRKKLNLLNTETSSLLQPKSAPSL